MDLIKKILKFFIRTGWLRAKFVQFSEAIIVLGSAQRHRKALAALRGKKEISVVYLATHASTWKYDSVYLRFAKDPRFRQTIVVCPLIYNDDTYMHSEMTKAFNMLESRGFNVVKGIVGPDGKDLDINAVLKPDIVFFSSPWYITSAGFVANNFLDKLTCYSPYGFYLSTLSLKAYTTFFHAVLWRNFLETGIHRKMYRKAGRRASNGVVTGSPGMDKLTDRGYKPAPVWKQTGSPLKKIIWAPHHSIREEGGEFDFSSFLKYSEFIPELATRFKNQVQIAFKPHPLLKNKLYAGDVWGQERTDAYYASWDNMENCQLCESDYTDLFLGSDGMIFDSISFIAEYLYINKPGLFTMTNSRIYDQLNDFGKVTISQHYHAFNENDIVNFVEMVILAGKDSGKAGREEFIMSELCSPGTDSAAECIYMELVKYI